MKTTFGQRDRNEPAPPPAQPVPAAPVFREEPVGDSLSILREQVLKEVDSSAVGNMPTDVLEHRLEVIIHEIANKDKLELSGGEQARLANELANDMTGYGPLQALLLDDTVDDIMVNGPNKVYVERRGKLERVAIRFRDNAHIAAVGQKIAARIGRRIDEASPMVDARLPDGSRVNVIIPPLAIDSPCISIRKFPTHHFDIAGMVANGTINAGLGKLLEIAARCRLNILVSGGTGSGKTTLLNALSRFIDHSERIVTIEDAAELQLQQPHVIRLETRPLSLEGTGLVTQRDLLRNCLRMRPDRIIVGEVRGEEAFDMLQAMNTGHDGSISTVHANSPRDALARLESMFSMANLNIPERAIRQQIASAIHVVVQVARLTDGTRKVVSISEITGMEGESIWMQDLFTF